MISTVFLACTLEFLAAQAFPTVAFPTVAGAAAEVSSDAQETG